jgi:hypothetical protein
MGTTAGAGDHDTDILAGSSWNEVVAGWTAAGQTLLARLHGLHHLSLLATLDQAGRPSIDSYDDAVEAYVANVRAIWQRARTGGAQPDDSSMAAAGSSPSDFVSRLVDDPASPPSTVLFVGFPGNPCEPEHTRFYVDAALSAFVEVPVASVLYTRDLPSNQAPLGGQFVWLRRDPDVLDQLQRALADAAQMQQRIWASTPNGNGPQEVPLSPFPDLRGAAPPARATSPSGAFDDDDDVPLPPGWPTAASG